MGTSSQPTWAAVLSSPSRVGELDGHALEPERVADAGTDRLQDAGSGPCIGEGGRDREQVLERRAVLGVAGGLARLVKRGAGDVGHRDEGVDVGVGGAHSRDGIVDAQDPDDLLVAAVHHHHQPVLWVPCVRVRRGPVRRFRTPAGPTRRRRPRREG